METIHSAAEPSSFRSRTMVGTATFTMVASTTIIDSPRLSMSSPSQRPRPVSVDSGRAACPLRGPFTSHLLRYETIVSGSYRVC